MKNQSGFTLIELIVVIVILGILAATALPKFIDLSGDADKAATQGVAGALSSAATINYGAKLVSNAAAVGVTNCAAVTSAMQTFDATKYTVAAGLAITLGATETCSVSSATHTINFTAIGA